MNEQDQREQERHERTWRKLDNLEEKISRSKTKYSSSLTAVVPPYFSKHNFLHRETELKKLEQKLQQQKCLVLVNGFGGIGKTSLAGALYHRIREKYDYVGWINYRGNLKQSFCADITEQFANIKDVDQKYAAIRSWMNSSDSTKLLFIDNVNKDSSTDPSMDFELQEITGWRNVSVVLTSRMEELPFYQGFPVEFMTEESCIDLFYLYYKNDSQRKQINSVRKLVNMVQRHTMSVELLAKAAKRENNLECYYRELKSKGFTFPEFKQITVAHNHITGTIASHLKILFDMSKLPDEHKQILWDFSVFPYLIYTSEEIRALLGYSSNELEYLVQSGWLSYQDDGYSMHPLVKEIIHLDKVDGEAPDGTANKFLHYWCNDYDKEQRVRTDEGYLSVNRKLTIAEEVLTHIRKENSVRFAHIYHNLACYYETNEQFQKAIDYYTKAVNIREKCLGSKHLHTALTYNNLGNVYRMLGKNYYITAEKFLLKAKKICEEVAGQNCLFTSMCYNNLGTVYLSMNKCGRAKKYFLKSKTIRENILGYMTQTQL